jgi:predicted dehydrogenase
MTWRQYKKYAGTGALGDITAHVISLSDFLISPQLGAIEELCSAWDIAIPERRSTPDASTKVKVDTDDQNYTIVKYKNGRIGVFYASRIATGKDCRMGFEIIGSKGTMRFSVDRINELDVYIEDGNEEEKGFRTLSPNTRHGDYMNYSIYDDMGISYSNVMGIQAQSFLKAIDTGAPPDVDMAYGYHVDRVMDAMIESINDRKWVKV